jgi:hypothetical protein
MKINISKTGTLQQNVQQHQTRPIKNNKNNNNNSVVSTFDTKKTKSQLTKFKGFSDLRLRSQATRAISNTASNNPPVNTNTSTEIKGTLTIRMSEILRVIERLLDLSVSNTSPELSAANYTTITVVMLSGQEISLTLPLSNASKLVSSNTFNANYVFAFGAPFPANVQPQLLFGLSISIINDLPFNNNANLSLDEARSFRSVLCVLLGLVLNIKTLDCACFPQSQPELSAVRAGLGLNCVKLECKNQLLVNPALFDSLFSNDCGENVSYQLAFVSLSAFAGGNVVVKDININQAFSCVAGVSS